MDWDVEGPHYLRFVSARGKTGVSEAAKRWLPELASHGDRAQLCLDGMEILQSMLSFPFFVGSFINGVGGRYCYEGDEAWRRSIGD